MAAFARTLSNGLARVGGCDDPEQARSDGELTHPLVAGVLVIIPAALAGIAVPLAISAGKTTTSTPKIVAITLVWMIVVLLIDIVVSRFGRLFPWWGRLAVLPARAVPAVASALFITALAVAGLLVSDTDRLWADQQPQRVAAAQAKLNNSLEATTLADKRADLAQALGEQTSARNAFKTSNSLYAAECSGALISGQTSGIAGVGAACDARDQARSKDQGTVNNAETRVTTLRGEVATAQAAFDKAKTNAGTLAANQVPTLMQRLDLTNQVIDENPGGAPWHWALVIILMFADLVPALWALLPRTLTEMRQLENRRRRTLLEQQLTTAVVAEGVAAAAGPAATMAEDYMDEQIIRGVRGVRGARPDRAQSRLRGLAPAGAVLALVLLAAGIGLTLPWGGGSDGSPTASASSPAVTDTGPIATATQKVVPARAAIAPGMLRADAPAYCRPLATTDISKLSKALPDLALSKVQDPAVATRNQQIVRQGLNGMTAAQAQLPSTLRPQVASAVTAATTYAANPTSGSAVSQLNTSLVALDRAFVKECAK